MSENFEKGKKANSAKQKINKINFYLFIYNIYVSISIKSLIIILFSTAFIYIQLKGKIYNKIDLEISIDNKYIYTSIVFLTSLLSNRAKSTFYTIHILTDNQFSIESFNIIKTILERFGKNGAKVIYYNLEDDFKGASIGGFALPVYYRIATPSVLSNVDKLIHSDTDIVNFKDLSELYSIKFKKDMYICAVLEELKVKKDVEDLGIKVDKYVNAGLLLMDLKAMRENSVEKKLRDFISTHNLKFCDQTAINAVCHDNIQIIPYKYNTFAVNSYEELLDINNGQNPMYKFNESEIYQAYHDPALVHFLGERKPWLKEYPSVYKIYWWYYAKISGYFNEILNYYKCDVNEIENLLKTIPEDGGLLKGKYKKFINLTL